jgi:hypothetical protein
MKLPLLIGGRPRVVVDIPEFRQLGATWNGSGRCETVRWLPGLA